MKRNLPIWLAKFLLGGMAVTSLAYLIGVNLWLNTGGLCALINTDADKLEINFGSAWSWYPGKVTVNGLSVRVQDTNVQFYFELGQVKVILALPPLLRKEFFARSVKGEKLSFRFRMKRRPDELKSSEWKSVLASIPGFDAPLFVAPPEEPEQETWRIHLENVVIKNVREIWFEEFRFQGLAEVGGGFNLWTGGKELEVQESFVRVTNGDVTLSNETVAGEITADLHASIQRLKPHEQAGGEFFRKIAGTIKGQANIEGMQFLNHYFRHEKWLQFGAAKGNLQLALAVDKGKLSADSKLALETDVMNLSLWGYHAQGKGSLKIDGPTLKARLDSFNWDNKLQGENLVVELTSPEVDLIEAAPKFKLALHLPSAHAGNLSFLNDFLPKTSPVQILGGSGRVTAHLIARSGRLRDDSGVITIEAENVEARIGTRKAKASVSVVGKIDHADIDGGVFDVSGSQVRIRMPQEEWWGNLDVKHAIYRTAGEAQVEGDVLLTARNARPFLDLYLSADDSSLPGFVKNILAFEGLEMKLKARFQKQSSYTHILATSEGTDMRGWLSELRGLRHGKVLFIYGPFAAGLGIDNSGTHLQLEDAYGWYGDKNRAE